MRNKLLRNLIWAYGERFFSQLITFIVAVILARILAPESIGAIAIVMVFIAICDAFVTGGFANALVQKKDVDSIDYDSVCCLNILMALLLYIVLFIAAPFIAAFYESQELTNVFRVMGLRFIFTAYNSVQQAYVQKKMIFKMFFWATIGGTIVSAFVGIWMAYKGCGIWSLVGQYLTNTVIDTFILFMLIDWKPRFRISWKSISELWKFGSKMLASTLVFTAKDNVRSLIIGKVFSTADLAYYNQGKRFPALLVTDVVESMGKVLFPIFSNEQKSIEVVKNKMRTAIQVSSYIIVPMIVGLVAVADNFVLAILTEKWIFCVPYLRVLCLVYLTRSINTVLQKGLLAIGKSSVNLFHETVTTVVTVFLLILAALVFKNIMLIAWSYVFVMLLGTIIFAFYSQKYLRYSYIEIAGDFIPTLAISIVMGVIVWFVGFLEMNVWIILLLQISLGIMLYLFFSWIFKLRGYSYLISLLSS